MTFKEFCEKNNISEKSVHPSRIETLKKAYEAGYCEHEIQTTKGTLEKNQFISDMSGVPRFSDPKIPNIDNPFLGAIFYA